MPTNFRETGLPAAAGAESGVCSPTSVLISLSAFGAAEVRRHGQLWFTQLSLQAGADGVEVRSELLLDACSELPTIAQSLRVAGKTAVYSCADHLWTGDGSLDTGTLERVLSETQLLGATRLKMATGGFGPVSHGSLGVLQQLLHATGIELLIENDQTPEAGTLPALQSFFQIANAHGLFLGMTFDIGNWHWTGECPLQAAVALATQVRYVHCKGVQRQVQRWVAVPLTQSCAPWRSVLHSLPSDVPWAIEYPLAGDDLLAVTRIAVLQLRQIAASMSDTSRSLASRAKEVTA